jgi:hypothetical protein
MPIQICEIAANGQFVCRLAIQTREMRRGETRGFGAESAGGFGAWARWHGGLGAVFRSWYAACLVMEVVDTRPLHTSVMDPTAPR